jgi:hypothetical protein
MATIVNGLFFEVQVPVPWVNMAIIVTGLFCEVQVPVPQVAMTAIATGLYVFCELHAFGSDNLICFL